MPVTNPRFHIEHQTAPNWPSEVVTHDECERHLRKLSRMACGCMKYGSWTVRPKATIYTASGLSTETNIARLFLTMSADQPLQATDFATHQCDDPTCAHPDHLLVGTHQTNVRDKFRPGRSILERKPERFYDRLLLEIPEPADLAPVISTPRIRVVAATCPPAPAMVA
ncbi:hypothetical protein LOK46_29685 [Methylobacterium sp. NMS14P]|uniref:hypothetical protein n=1 Tax=Methylobacterium sp. NMS14P TaxID=2894310 RepID=UPI0023599DF9|nr:hypothetical protein [Methylobacterium sp. NMS14P]WCS25239.1 hypothetical protein LOK46_29685 [Methylobacterium sp. NMS14P]